MILFIAAQPLLAATLDVPGNANIFGAGHAVAPDPGGSGGGVLPPVYSFPAATNRVVIFSSVSGFVGIDSSTDTNGPDGGFLDYSTDISSFGGIAGIIDNQKTMFLVGVFLDDNEPVDPAPERLDFSSTALTENFQIATPALRQVFFVGDGLRGTGTGAAQRFLVPNGATRLYLGFADAWNGTWITGLPGSYADNHGSISAEFEILLYQTNSWTRSASGNWEESYWSLGQLPGTNQDLVSINNAGWKAVAIGANTTTKFPESLSLNNLVIDAPTNSFNTLLLNWAQLDVPLSVNSILTIGTNGALVSHYSALNAANVFIDGSAAFMDDATENFGQVTLRSGGTLGLTNGAMTTSNLTFYTGNVTQSGGTHTVGRMGNASGDFNNPYMGGGYNLQDGTLVSGGVSLGTGGGYGPQSFGGINQTGGVHTNASMSLWGWETHYSTIALGSYSLSGGLFVSQFVNLVSGAFHQAGGTNRIEELHVQSGNFVLTDGELTTSNEFIDVYPEVGTVGFNQSGGAHTVRGQMSVSGPPYEFYHTYSFRIAGGSLVTSNIVLESGALVLSQGTVSNAGILALSGGALVGSTTSSIPYLGQLQVSGGDLYAHAFASWSQPTVWRFGDSRTQPWTGSVRVWDWQSGDHIFIGTNAQGLTPAQLGKVSFASSWDDGEPALPAMLLPTGELVPATATNEWTKSTSGNWEDAYWSLGRMPGMDQATVLFDNPGWKALAIGANTTYSYPDSLSLHNLLVDAPSESLNTLLLNWAGLSVPLNVYGSLTVGTNGAVECDHSAVHAVNSFIHGSMSFTDRSIATLDQLWLQPEGWMRLSDGSMTCSNVNFDGAVFDQYGGTNTVQNLNLPQQFSSYDGPPLYSYYNFYAGQLTSSNLTVSYAESASGQINGDGAFSQSGGIHTNLSMTLLNYSQEIFYSGQYYLNGGVLVSSSIDCRGGSFQLIGGSCQVQELTVRGSLFQGGGELISSNAALFWNGSAIQSGGSHTVKNRLVIGSGSADSTYFDIDGGSLVTANIDIQSGLFRMNFSAAVSNAGILTFSGGSPGRISFENATNAQYLGQLQLNVGGTLDLHETFAQPNNPTLVRFADSHTLPWFGQLQITNWGGFPGDHIYFGTNAQALTTSQLALITFAPRGGAANQGIPAQLLSTGELVPAAPPPLAWTNSGHTLVLSWQGGYQLTTATNIDGPYMSVPAATSPYTNDLTEPQRFFRLQIPTP